MRHALSYTMSVEFTRCTFWKHMIPLEIGFLWLQYKCTTPWHCTKIKLLFSMEQNIGRHTYMLDLVVQILSSNKECTTPSGMKTKCRRFPVVLLVLRSKMFLAKAFFVIVWQCLTFESCCGISLLTAHFTNDTHSICCFF